MLNKALICVVMLAVIFGCSNQKETADQAEQTPETETTEQVEQPKVAVEEISLTVTGMV